MSRKVRIIYKKHKLIAQSKMGFFLAILFLLVSATIALPNTLQVPNDYLTIQEAVYGSQPGDTIIVASGVYRLYSGNITITKESIILKSAHGAKKTVIEGRTGGPVITFVENSHSVIDGFTIRSVDEKHTPALEGGGVYCAPSSSPTITNNLITAHKAVFGGGVYCAPYSSPFITNNTISKNHASRFGGAIASYRASPNIGNNQIVGNKASNAGGGIFCYKGSPRITNNCIWQNEAKSGGGISCDRSDCTIINNTVTMNAGIHGGGVFFDGGSVRIINAILWNNKDDLYSAWFSPASRPDHSDIGGGDFRGLNGNISADPLFMDPENGDFRLRTNSPCIDVGNQDPIYNDPDGSKNDMGAYGGPKAYSGR
ncbi:MAG: right-handed parallel beta-helix repeat-containing protein [Thermodesulfobacteriota bacterium]|nr:right-handed parallel beta-helix repeat-containing protein [Thermodesulfobacteriota bacterium]